MNARDEYTPLLPGIGFAGYRSFASWQTFRFPTRVTVLAGINNSGKSNVLRFLQDVMPQLIASGPGAANQRPGRAELGDLDLPRGFDGETALQVGVPVVLGAFGERHDPMINDGYVGGSLAGFKEGLMTLLSEDGGDYWSRFKQLDGQFVPDASAIERAMLRWPNWSQRHYNEALSVLGGGTVDAKDIMERIATSIGGFAALPPVVTIASTRRVEATDDVQPDWLSGRGIIRALAQIQNPPHGEWHSAQPRWRAINAFVQAVLGDDEAHLNIPYDFSTIQVQTPQRVLPLSSLGSGVEQVVVLAAAATVTTSSLVCVEEPETNLHPLLQKKLVRYLTDNTDNQYVIATHSSHLLDDGRASAYHIRLTAGGSVASLARRPHQLVGIFHDLGYRPSDLLQANCVIWVEGPSDRTYIRRWLQLLDPLLVEGIDFSIMFYGGGLLSHLTTSEDALEDFISLRRLNRSSAVVIDSDKKSSRQRINATKKRIQTEFEAAHPAPGFAWVTRCYTVENYIPSAILQAAVKKVHPARTYVPADQWENPLPKEKDASAFDKVGIASVAAPMLTTEDLNVFDLRQKVTALRDFIAAANGQSVAPDPSTSAE